jgi:hypothetical protein
MNKIREKLKSKWVLTIIVIVLLFLIRDINLLSNLEIINRNLVLETGAYKIGYVTGYYLRPILDLIIIYSLLFKIDLVQKNK